jgi:hypothetical protein
VPAPSADVAVDGATGLRRERRQAALTALAPAHRRDSAHQIDVSHGEVEELTGVHAGFGHPPQDRLVAPIAKVSAAAGLSRRRNSSSVSESVTFESSLGALRPSNGSSSISPSSASHAENRRIPSWRARAVAGFGAGVEQIGHPVFDQVAIQCGGVALLGAPAQEPANAVAVLLIVCADFRSARIDSSHEGSNEARSRGTAVRRAMPISRLAGNAVLV